MAQKGRNKTETKKICDRSGDIKYQVLNFGLIPDTLNPTSNITIDSNNWSLKVETGENKTKAKGETPSKRIRIDTGIDNVESESYDSNTFSPYYEELCKILPHVVSVLNANNQLDVLLFFLPLLPMKTLTLKT